MLIIKPIEDLDLAELGRLRVQAIEAQQRLETYLLVLEGKYRDGEEGVSVSFEGDYAFIRDTETADELSQLADMRKYHRLLMRVK